MSEEKKEGSCGTQGSGGCCCSGKKLVLGIIIGALLLAVGMWFGKSCFMGSKICPISGAPMMQK